VFEWGGGGSTLFFLDHGCSVVTVESQERWLQEILKRVGSSSVNLDLRFRPLSDDDFAANEAYVNAVHNGAPWDLILVDGEEKAGATRLRCVEAARTAIASGGVIVLDDAWRHEYDAISGVLLGTSAFGDFRREEFWGVGPARFGVTKTDVYKKL
jgi:predicted O-methyltransferase YrrM